MAGAQAQAKAGKVARTIIEVCLALSLVGCGASDREDSAPSGPVTSEHGVYVGELSLEPNPPTVGENAVGLWLESAGAPVADASVEVQAYMPAHGHSSASAWMTMLEPGSYRADGVVYNMPGTWELTFTISAAAGTDALVIEYTVR